MLSKRRVELSSVCREQSSMACAVGGIGHYIGCYLSGAGAETDDKIGEIGQRYGWAGMVS